MREFLAEGCDCGHAPWDEIEALVDAYDRRGAALDAARADVERLRRVLDGLELTEQTCPAGMHVTWHLDAEGGVACPSCRRDEARAERDEARAEVARLSAQREAALALAQRIEDDGHGGPVEIVTRALAAEIRAALGASDGA